MYRASASRVPVTDSTFGAAAISLSMVASRWCRVPTCVDVRREEALCARGGGSPNRGVSIATASQPTAASGAGNHRRTYASPNTRMCAEFKRMAAAAAASAGAA